MAEGIGKPEPLRANLSGLGSRRIDDTHRLVYTVVEGTLVFEREVELFVHPSAKIGAVSGAQVRAWTDTLPPRRD